jgi:thaumarchaeosortase
LKYDLEGLTERNQGCRTLPNRIFGLSSNIAAILILVMPIVFAIFAYPNTFNLSWNQGRGGFLFALAFIFAELWGLKLNIQTKRYLIVIGLSVAVVGYFVELPLGLKEWIILSAPNFRVNLIYSWTWMWDFVIMGLYVISAEFILFGKSWYKIASAGAIYLAGSALILFLDAFFPYDSLGLLQFIVPYYLRADQWLIQFIQHYIMHLGSIVPAIAEGNLLVLNGLHGHFALKVFWPSAGVQSMIIYSLVMLAFLLKMNIPKGRKAIYFGVGIIGTALINLVRIIALSLFALLITTNIAQWETFHSVAGEIMFLPWLGIYLASVIFLEGKRMKIDLKYHAHKSSSSPNPAETKS